MYGYKIKINCLPTVVWASETTVDHYQWENRNREDMLEISFCVFDTKTEILNGKERVLNNHALSCVAGAEKRASFCKTGDPITIVSVAVKLTDFQIEAGQLTDGDIRDPSRLLLPAVWEGLSLEEELAITALLRKLIRAHTDRSANSNAVFVSGFFELLSKIDKSLRKSRDAAPGSRYDFYIEKANSIIARRYAEKITLTQVAQQLHISPVYLSALYKKFTGITFSEHLLNIRMQQADKLLIDQNIPTAKVAAMLGFCDENHFRKKFKQFYGMNVREYRNIKSGLTLHHKAPTPGKPQEE